MNFNYSPSERLNKVMEILAEGVLETLDMLRSLDFYKEIWEQETLTGVVFGIPLVESAQNPCATTIEWIYKRRGITATALAEKLGVSPAYIAEIETGAVQPTKKQMGVLHSILDGDL